MVAGGAEGRLAIDPIADRAAAAASRSTIPTMSQADVRATGNLTRAANAAAEALAVG